jgi:hypothetical protein
MSTVAVFGATSAIAESVARRYAERGSRFYLVARNSEKLETVANDLKARGASGVVLKEFDFLNTAELPSLFDDLASKFGAPNRALIAFGTLPEQAAIAADPQEAARALEMNFLAPALVLHFLARVMRGEHSAIAVIGSVAGDRGRASNYVYGAAKAGLAVYAQGLAHERARTEPKVILIKPGFVDTPMTDAFKKGPLWAQPQDVAADIVRALERERSGTVYTPWFWRWIMLLIRLMPQFVMHRTKL